VIYYEAPVHQYCRIMMRSKLNKDAKPVQVDKKERAIRQWS
jgi:hypothetical protein